MPKKKAKKVKVEKVVTYVGGTKNPKYPASVPKKLQTFLKNANFTSCLDVSDKGHDIVGGFVKGTSTILTEDQEYNNDDVREIIYGNYQDRLPFIYADNYEFIHFNAAIQPRGVLFCLLAATYGQCPPSLIVMRGIRNNDPGVRGINQFLSGVGGTLYDVSYEHGDYAMLKLKKNWEHQDTHVRVVIDPGAVDLEGAEHNIAVRKIRALIGWSGMVTRVLKQVRPESIPQDAETIERLIAEGNEIPVPTNADESWIPCLPAVRAKVQ